MNFLHKKTITILSFILIFWIFKNLNNKNNQNLKIIKSWKQKIKKLNKSKIKYKFLIKKKVKKKKIIFIEVEIRGAIKYPGIYKLKKGNNFLYLLNKAGGFTNKADKTKTYKNYYLKDGQSYYIKFNN